MSADGPVLPTALHQITDGAAAHVTLQATGLSFDTIHTAARRRRIRFGSGVGVAAAAMVGGVAFGVIALGGAFHLEPVQPAQTDVTRTPAPGPAPTSTPEPTAWDVDYSLCGYDPESITWMQGDVVALPMQSAPSADAQATVAVSTVYPPTPSGGDAIVEAGTRHLIVAVDASRGTVVGVPGTPAGEAPDQTAPVGDDATAQVALTTTTPLFSCAQQDGTRLEPGRYTLTIAQRIITDGTDGLRVEHVAVGSDTLTVPGPSGSSAAMPVRTPDEHYASSPSSFSTVVSLSGDTLEDGDYLGNLLAICAEAGIVDVAVTGFDNSQATTDTTVAGDPGSPDPTSPGYHIVNDTRPTRALPLSPDVVIWEWCTTDEGIDFRRHALTDWQAARDSGEDTCGAPGSAYPEPRETYWFDVRDGVVVQVVSRFVS
jgi:hypothetical protein